MLQQKAKKKPPWLGPRVRWGLVRDKAREVGKSQILQGREGHGGDLSMEGI